ncbi:Isoleucyl-tRNA synthetase [Thermoplasmatales archaeon SCGC AB-540-F20]|nr:Isoleucyl-tRNA synthetase [Thermoplasmatales archaeon SCGC AB-540-F20]
MIQSPPQKYIPKEIEEKIQKFWKENKIFKKSIEQRKGCKPYVFLEGPPTANGLPHPGHVLTRVMKDLVLRYQTMNGHYIGRKAGWDTHGLPVEIEVEKQLGLEDKQAIERYGVTKFNEACKKSTLKYERAWVDMTHRIAFWLDMDDPYITFKNEYIESVWWSLKQAWKNKLLYKGHKVVPYCPRCGTVLSAHEVAQGYKIVEEPSIFVKFKLKNEDSYFLAWTTTPWTLISNVALAVHPDEPYIKIRYKGQTLILAEARVAALLKGQEYELLDGFSGKELGKIEYEPLFTYAKPDKKAWYVVCADFVTMEDGTGIVHIAPAFGEDDYNIGREYDLPVVQLVKLDGTFPDEVTPWKGQFVKDADPSIIEHLEERGLLEGTRDYTHEYPFCWRCDSPLLYYAMESWFIAMSKVQDSLIKNNNQINWYPQHLQRGRFGDFIREVKDWALSRDRYWGTPLPIWICDNKECNYTICVGSVQELRDLSESSPAEYDLHKPFVDELVIKCPKCKSKMTREKEVIDCWYDSGSSFFAQWHYPFENKEKFKENFPVDFITEALDQTRGWFYSLLAISTFLFDKNPYKTVLTLGLVLDKDNQKMSKSKKNYVDPTIILDHEGADALRWYLISANAPWMSTRFYEEAVKDTLGRFILTFWNSYNFFTTYASLDKFDPEKDMIPVSKRGFLDKWVLSRFNRLIGEIHTFIETFEIHKAARAIERFIIDDFSNWYLRRSRKRLWVEERTEDKLSGYSSMYDIFLGLSKLLAPFIPFIIEETYQNLRTDKMPESIHLCDYLTPDEKAIDDMLEKGMGQIRELVEVGRALRSKIGIKIRYPLSDATIVCSKEIENSIKDLLGLLKEELNVKTISFARDTSQFMTKSVKPIYSHLGPKYKEKAKGIIDALELLDKQEIYEELTKNNEVKITVDNETIKLTDEDFEIVENEKEHVARADAEDATLFLNTILTPELEAEGFAREIIRRIQSMRKELDLDVEDRISTRINVGSEKKTALQKWEDYIKGETRSKTVSFVEKPAGKLVKKWKIDELDAEIGISK